MFLRQAALSVHQQADCDAMVQYSCFQTLYLVLGPMGSLWAYIEGMVCHSLPFLATNSSDLAAWARFSKRFGILRPSSSDARSSCVFGCIPILLRMLQHCIWDPWGAFGHILKEWCAIPSPSWQPTALIWLPGPDFQKDLAYFDPLRVTLAPPVCLGASQFFYACCNIAFGTHGEPLGIY